MIAGTLTPTGSPQTLRQLLATATPGQVPPGFTGRLYVVALQWVSGTIDVVTPANSSGYLLSTDNRTMVLEGPQGIPLSLDEIYLTGASTPIVRVAADPAPDGVWTGEAVVDPLTVAGLLGLWRADEVVGVDNDPINPWPDISGLSNSLTQGVAASRPLLKTGIINGHDVGRFDGVNDNMVSANNPPSANNPSIVFVVFSVNDMSTFRSMFSWGAASADNIRGLRIEADGDALFFFFGDDLAGVAGITPGVPLILTLIFDGANKFIRKNGVQIATHASTTNTTATVLTLGVSALVAEPFFSGDIAELILYGSGPTASDIIGIENFLKQRYAIA